MRKLFSLSLHFLDDYNNYVLREYVKDKQKCKSACCMDYFIEAEQKKDRTIEYPKSYLSIILFALSDNAITMHFNSI
jgi:hypothetical protein